MADYVKLILEMEEKIKNLKLENMCDVCAGTGATLHGGPCMCGGTGKMTDAARYLREELIKARNPYDEKGLCPTCHSPDNMRAHNEPCYYCGLPINNLAANPGEWSLQFPHSDEPGVTKPHHVRCVTKRLISYDLGIKFSGGEVNAKQLNCEHTYVPSNPESQEKYQSSGAKCSQCGHYPQHWYCPSNPYHLCSYTEDYDSCDYCHEPEERK